MQASVTGAEETQKFSVQALAAQTCSLSLRLWQSVREPNSNESLILAQNQRWRRAYHMQVERESLRKGMSKVATG